MTVKEAGISHRHEGKAAIRRTVNFTNAKVTSESLEKRHGHVKAVVIFAGRASIGDNSGGLLVVRQVGDGHGLATVGGDCASVTILGRVESDNEVVVRVDCAASASDAVLSEPGTTDSRRGSISPTR